MICRKERGCGTEEEGKIGEVPPSSTPEDVLSKTAKLMKKKHLK